MEREHKIDLAVDTIIFGYQKETGVQVLLIKRKYDPFKDNWAIPGGFVEADESLDEAARRELKEETGIDIEYIEQLYTFGEPKRDPRKRVISVAYFSLVKSSEFMRLNASSDAKDAKWFNINEMPDLAFDHKYILEMAISRLRKKIIYEPIGFELLDDKFPFSDLENLYSTLLGRDIDRRNFKKKVMKLGILEELSEKAKNTGAGRPGNLYRFNKNVYNTLINKGIHFEI